MSDHEPSEHLRMVAFIALALLILFTWAHFFKPPEPPPQKPGQTAQQPAPAQAHPSGSGQAGAAQSRTGATTAAAGSPVPVKVPTVQASQEKVVVVESPLYRVELSNRGGVVRSWKLKKYLDDQKPAHPLDLVDPNSSQQLGWPFSLLLSDPALQTDANDALYEVTPTPVLSDAPLNAPAEIAFHWSDSHLDVTKKLNFTQGYEMSVETSVTLDGMPLGSAIAWRGGFGDKSVYKASQLVTVFYETGGKLNLLQYKKLGVSGNQGQPLARPGPMEFLGIEDQFFTATFLPDGTDLSLWDWTQDHKFADGTEPEAEMAAGTAQPAPLRMRVFVGPKDLALLSKVKPSLEELVNFGWTGIIAKPLLFVVQWLHRYIPNFGWTIVVLTLVINFALFPLKMKSWRSMQKMQRVAPEIRSIQDRYKKYSLSDPRKKKMNEEVMAIYSREGINPMGSCLPMLVQAPIWWALWRVLTGAIELRHAPWFGWIHDLSARDPYYILPVAMAITMYLMTKMTPQTAAVDPAQQKMMQFMPLFFAAFFFTLSSGLNLYMFTSNLVGVGQQYYLNRTQPLPAPKGKFKKKTG